MHPPAPHPARRRHRRTRRLVVTAASGVAAGVGLLILFASLGGQGGGEGGPVQNRFVDERFEIGSTERLAGEIAADGPILLPDAGPGRSKDVYVQHLGSSPDTGWLVFDARAPGSDRRCTLAWQPSTEVFVDPCTGQRHPADGGDLDRYETTVRKGTLVVDLRSRVTDG